MLTLKPKVEIRGDMAVVKTAFPYSLAHELKGAFTDVFVGDDGVVVMIKNEQMLEELERIVENFVLDDEVWWTLESDTPTRIFELTRRDIREFIESLDKDQLWYLKQIIDARSL